MTLAKYPLPPPSLGEVWQIAKILSPPTPKVWQSPFIFVFAISDCKNMQPPQFYSVLVHTLLYWLLLIHLYTPDLTIWSYICGSCLCNFLYIPFYTCGRQPLPHSILQPVPIFHFYTCGRQPLPHSILGPIPYILCT